MNRFICRAFAFALLVASPSFAADMPGGRYQEPVEAPVYNWGGGLCRYQRRIWLGLVRLVRQLRIRYRGFRRRLGRRNNRIQRAKWPVRLRP